MNTMKTMSKNLIPFILVIILTSCNAVAPKLIEIPIPIVTSLPTSTSTPEPTQKVETATKTPVPATQTSTNVPTPSPFVETPLPTLSPDDAYKRFQSLLEDDATCRLPCWWGITSGKTTWHDAERFLQTFNSIDTVDYPDGSFRAYVNLPLPQEKGTLNHTYHIKNKIIYSIEAYDFDWAPSLYLGNFLSTYGPPDEIFIRTFRNGLDNSWPYVIDLFYANSGIFMEYSGGNPKIVGKNVKNCFTVKDMDSPFIYLWSSNPPITSSEAIKRFLDTENMPYPIPLEKATGMKVDAFYNEFKNADKSKCLETPLDLWPEY